MNKKSKQTELSYYGLYLLNHLRENNFPQATDGDFIRERADHAAEVYEQARRSDLFADAAQELAMSALLKGLHLSKYNFGERWIPTGVYSAYMSHLFNTQVTIVYSDSMDEQTPK